MAMIEYGAFAMEILRLGNKISARDTGNFFKRHFCWVVLLST